MRTASLGALMGAALIAACFVDRPSKAFECDSNADCVGFTDNRTCKNHFCAVSNCPRDCTMCDEEMQICMAECTSAESCGSVTCPSGWTCTIHCTGGNACSDITCSSGSKCDVTCSGTDACATLSCAGACQCDLTCGTGACNTPSCPFTGNGGNRMECTSDGTTTGNCDSARAAGCTKC